MEEAERLCERVAIIEHGRLIEMGTPDELVRRHCPQRRVAYVTEEDGREVRHELSGEGDDFVTDVIHRIAREGTRVKEFRTAMPTLEDVFLKLTGKAIRD
jgi:ABC-2 type transport system ATP-binding protein